jgi:hypothetical protein
MGDIDEWLRVMAGEWGISLDRLKELQSKAHQIETRLNTLYAEKFPKKCNSCDRVYHNREEYLAATAPTGERHVRFEPKVEKVQEFRNCVCGSTLLIMLPERRDMSEFGHERRAIFDQMVVLLKELKDIDTEEAKIIVRKIFRTLADRSSKSG